MKKRLQLALRSLFPKQALLNAVFYNDLPAIELLLLQKPFPNEEVNAFCQAIGWGRKEAVTIFIQRGANVNLKDRNGNHPLDMACHSPVKELFRELIQHGSDPRQADGLATKAAGFGRADILKYLHDAGFDLNQPDKRGYRPIDSAIGAAEAATIEYLLSVDVDVSHVDASKPLEIWKGALPEPGAMENIRSRIIEKSKRGRGGEVN